jgi:7-carboxy-7-deazaguanine synthase
MTTTGPDMPASRHRERGLLVAERFGPTFQGEGSTAGRQALFIRLSTCNLACAWCDEPQTWDWTRFDPAANIQRIHPDDLAAWALTYNTPRVVITGGEPLLQQTALVPLVQTLAGAGRAVEIETNGTVAPGDALTEAVEHFTVSPKLSGSQLTASRRIVPAALAAFVASGKAVFKFVVTTTAELEEVADLQQRFALAPVWLMPEATDTDAVLAGMRGLAGEALARGWNLSPRLHVLLWGNVRGR